MNLGHIDLTKAVEQVANKLIKPEHTPHPVRQQGKGHMQGRRTRKNYEHSRKSRQLMSKRSRQINRRK